MGKKSKRRNPPSKSNNKKKGQKKKSQANQSAQCGADGGIVGAKQGGSVGVDWTHHDAKLNGMRFSNNTEEDYDDDDDDNEINDEFASMSIKNDGEGTPSHPKGSRDALRAALDRAWSDAAISDPHGVGLAMGPKDEWMDWAMPMATEPDRLDKFWDEYIKDMKMHKSILEKLSKGMKEGSCECTDYIMALNCIFHDSFGRLSMDYPPFLNLEQGMMSMNFERIRQQSRNMRQQSGCKLVEPVYESHMKIWKGYENRALRLMKLVQEHPLVPKPQPSEFLPADADPLKYRGEFPLSADRREEWESDYSDDEYESAFGACNGFSGADVEELLSQGVKPWDDDAGAVLAALNGY